jgi:TP53 regulating kinase-like protein
VDATSNPRLIKKGAEASLFLATWHRKKVIIKRRLPKKYRSPLLDERIRSYRTIHEPQLIHEAKKAGVPTPIVYLVDPRDSAIIMEFIEGRQLKEILDEATKNERQKLCRAVGNLIGRLHKGGIIHGDLTTSNMILSPSGRVYFVDFGLGEKKSDLEARGVDLHLMKRAFQSVHFKRANECFETVFEGYREVFESDMAEDVLGKIGEIEKRGRYVAEREEKN